MKTLALFLLIAITASADILRFVCIGTSMLPLLPQRSEQWVDTEGFDRIAIGSIVIFKNPASPSGRTSHRVFKQIEPGVWWTKGTHNPLPDRLYVTRENFVGLVIGPAQPQSPGKK